MVHVIQVCWQLVSRIRMEFHPNPACCFCYKNLSWCTVVWMSSKMVSLQHEDLCVFIGTGTWSPWLGCKNEEQSSKIKEKGAGEPVLTDTVKRVFWKFQQSLGKSIVLAENCKFLRTTMLKNVFDRLGCMHTCKQCKQFNLTVAHIGKNVGWECWCSFAKTVASWTDVFLVMG